MENQEQLASLHAEHADWQNQIQHYKGELKSMKEELGVIVSKLAPREVPSNAEHFQNQFILQRDVLDVMRHDFKQYENQIESAQRNNGTSLEHLLQVRDAYQVRLKDYDKLYHELKNEFTAFKRGESVPA
jgi:hypothetical protein